MSGAIITAVGGVLAAVVTILVGWFVKRTDNVAKMTRANMEDQRYVMKLVGALRDDYWTLADAWWHVRSLAGKYRSKLLGVGVSVDPVELPEEPPVPRHRAIEALHARGEDPETDGK